jgi:hypothetical protein
MRSVLAEAAAHSQAAALARPPSTLRGCAPCIVLCTLQSQMSRMTFDE